MYAIFCWIDLTNWLHNINMVQKCWILLFVLRDISAFAGHLFLLKDDCLGKIFRHFKSLKRWERTLWFVLDEVEEISKEQIEFLKAPFGKDCYKNLRPVQRALRTFFVFLIIMILKTELVSDSSLD